jgi:zinc and cadmium transporter
MVAVNLVGDTLHNVIDGMIIASAYLVGPEIGVTTTVAVVLHEIPQELGDFGVLIRGGMRVPQAIRYNLLSACAAVVGAAVALTIGQSAELFANVLVPITAGGFIYLAGTDLLPELQEEPTMPALVRDVALMATGVLLMVALGAIE